MLYDSGFVLIRLIHRLNSYINSDLSMIVYGGAKISPMCNDITYYVVLSIHGLKISPKSRMDSSSRLRIA